MAKRRASGDGMVRKIKRGLWEGRVVIGHKKDDSPIFKYAYAHTQKELGEKLRALDGAYHNRDLTEEMMLTLQAWLNRWCRESLPLAMGASTAERCRAMIQNHIVPRLGQKRLADLTTDDIQKFCNALRKDGRLDGKEGDLSDTMVLRVFQLLRQSLDAAVRARLIPANPADGVQLPKRRRTQKQILNDAQLNTLLKAIEGDEDWHDFFYTELTTGLRRGEICALRWEDFDEAEGRLHVRRTLKKEGGALVCGDTKTYAGRRAILLPPSTAELLRERKRASFTEWIFPNPLRPEQPMNPTTAYENMKRILKRAGLPSIRFHDLRHTFATHALASGVDAKTLAGILGHTNASFTLDTYTHVTDDMKETASGIVGDFMEEIFGKELTPWQDARQGTA